MCTCAHYKTYPPPRKKILYTVTVYVKVVTNKVIFLAIRKLMT